MSLDRLIELNCVDCSVREASNGAQRGILVFLHLRAEAAEFGCYCSVCLGKLFFEGFAPVEGNQGDDDYEFSQ